MRFLMGKEGPVTVIAATTWSTSRNWRPSASTRTRTWSARADTVKVKLLGFDNRGKVRLSMKQVDQATGEDISKKQGGEEQSGEETPQGE